MKESTIESKTVNYAKSKGWLVYKFTSPANRAVPDRIFIRHSIVFFIEFKAPGKKPTKLQKKVHDDINFHQVPVYVIDNFPLGKELVDSFECFSLEKEFTQEHIQKIHEKSGKFGSTDKLDISGSWEPNKKVENFLKQEEKELNEN